MMEYDCKHAFFFLKKKKICTTKKRDYFCFENKNAGRPAKQHLYNKTYGKRQGTWHLIIDAL